MRLLVCLAACVIIAVPVFSQTIFIANSNPGAVTGANIFTGTNAINDAIAAASDGDVIYVVPSGNLYGASNVNKALTIYGGGFHPDKTTSLTSSSNNITVSVNNVRISGMVVGPILAVSNGVTGTMIDKCRINRISLGSNVSNVIIQNCIVGENTSGQYSITGFDLTTTGVRVASNLIYGTSSSGYLMYLKNSVIEHNVFVGMTGAPASDAFNIIQDSEIKNNIFYGIEPQGSNTLNYLNNSQHHNLSFGGTVETFVSTTGGNTEANNIIGSDPLFVNLPLATPSVYYNTSNDATLQVGSPALGQGELNVDMGAHGGATPFDPFGTSLPIVQSITAPATVPQGTNMDVRIQGKGN